MGKYGYKFIGNDGFAIQLGKKHDESLSSEQSHNVNNNITVNITLADGQTLKTGSCENPEDVSETEQKIADCIYKIIEQRIKSLAQEQSANVNNNITVNIKLADGQTSKTSSCEKPENMTDSDQKMADCVSKLAISLAKHKQKYNL